MANAKTKTLRESLRDALSAALAGDAAKCHEFLLSRGKALKACVELSEADDRVQKLTVKFEKNKQDIENLLLLQKAMSDADEALSKYRQETGGV